MTFENPEHDFPKMVEYTVKPDGSLEASISGAGGERDLLDVQAPARPIAPQSRREVSGRAQ